MNNIYYNPTTKTWVPYPDLYNIYKITNNIYIAQSIIDKTNNNMICLNKKSTCTCDDFMFKKDINNSPINSCKHIRLINLHIKNDINETQPSQLQYKQSILTNSEKNTILKFYGKPPSY